MSGVDPKLCVCFGVCHVTQCQMRSKNRLFSYQPVDSETYQRYILFETQNSHLDH